MKKRYSRGYTFFHHKNPATPKGDLVENKNRKQEVKNEEALVIASQTSDPGKETFKHIVRETGKSVFRSVVKEKQKPLEYIKKNVSFKNKKTGVEKPTGVKALVGLYFLFFLGLCTIGLIILVMIDISAGGGVFPPAFWVLVILFYLALFSITFKMLKD